MTPCPQCNRHVRGETCPFCGAECVQVTRIRIGRAARATLLALGATVSADTACGTMYGGQCKPDACTYEQPTKDAEDESTFAFPDVTSPDADVSDGQPRDALTADADAAEADDSD